jgi:hypothetical protein
MWSGEVVTQWEIDMHVRRSGLVLVVIGALLGLMVPAASAADPSSRPARSVSFNGAVTAMVRQGSTVYLVGAFTRATDGSGEHVRRHVAAVNARNGRLLPWHSAVNGTPLAITRFRNQLFIGGNFTKARGVRVAGLARMSTVNGKVSRKFRPRPKSTVRALAVNKHAVYVGGDFRRLNGVRRQHLGAVTRSSGSLLKWRPRADKAVAALSLRRGSIYAGGTFTTVNGKRHAHLVALRLSGRGKVRASFHPRIRYQVTSVTFAKRSVAVTEAGPGGRLVLLRPNGRLRWVRTFDGDAEAVTVMGRRLYVGGHWDFICPTTRVAPGNGDCLDPGELNRPRLLSYTFGGRLTAWSPDPGPQSVMAIARVRNRIAVGGDFTTFQGGTVARPNFALFAS